MNKKRVTLGATILIIIICLCLVLGVNIKRNIYNGKGIPYISNDGKKVKLTLYNWDKDEVHSKIIGKQNEIFWMTTNVTDDFVVSADNKNNIYCYNADNIEVYDNVTDNIIEVRCIGENNLVVSQVDNTVYINLYSSDFSEVLQSQEISGNFAHLFVNDYNCYISLLDLDNYNNTIIYKMSIDRFELVKLIDLDESVDIYPFEYNDELYLCYNEKIHFENKIDINTIYRLEGNELREVCYMDDTIFKMVNFKNQVMLLSGEKDTNIVNLNVNTGEFEKVYSIAQEQPKGMYVLNEKLYIISDSAFYVSKDNQLIKIMSVQSMLNNYYK